MVGRDRFLSQPARLEDPRWMFAPQDLPMTALHPKDELRMPEDAPTRGRRSAAGGTGRRPVANATPPRPPANSRDRRRRERMGIRIGAEKAQEEAEEIGRHEDEGDAGGQPHVSPTRPQWFDHDIIGSSSMMQAPPAPQSAHPRPFQEVFEMMRTPEPAVLSQAASYKASRDHHLDPFSSTVGASPHPPHGLGCTVSDFGGTLHQYGTPLAYYDFMSGPIPTTTQVETTPTEPSGPPPEQRPTRAARPPPCGTGGHLHHGSGYM
ncbi:hypothetical protein PIB30_015669 [Stylosanthes scabra]|uniref:Uncharacterized protein n=1 Tax=Stylosanthes scabra TaxID=79078 RepID=A0ABU6U5V9_9FABA|nr:hypothetical protein [Stylosanthes scabra]